MSIHPEGQSTRRQDCRLDPSVVLLVHRFVSPVSSRPLSVVFLPDPLVLTSTHRYTHSCTHTWTNPPTSLLRRHVYWNPFSTHPAVPVRTRTDLLGSQSLSHRRTSVSTFHPGPRTFRRPSITPSSPCVLLLHPGPRPPSSPSTSSRSFGKPSETHIDPHLHLSVHSCLLFRVLPVVVPSPRHQNIPRVSLPVRSGVGVRGLAEGEPGRGEGPGRTSQFASDR